MQSNRVTVDVAGMPITLRGAEDEEYIRSVAAYVDEKATTYQKSQPALSTSNCVVLAAVNIADELFKLRQQYAELDRRIEELRRLTVEQSAPRYKGPVKRPFEEQTAVKAASAKEARHEVPG